MNCDDDYGNCRQGRDCPARAARVPACTSRLGRRAAAWELVEAAALVLLGIVAICATAGYLYASFGAEIELALWRVADAAWALAGRLS